MNTSQIFVQRAKEFAQKQARQIELSRQLTQAAERYLDNPTPELEQELRAVLSQLKHVA